MSRENLFWLIVFVIGAVALAGRAMTGQGMAKEYVRVVDRAFVKVTDTEADAETRDAAEWVELGSEDVPTDLDVNAVPDEDVIRWTEYKGASYTDYLEYQQAQEQVADGTATAGANAIAVGSRVELSFWRSLGVWIGAFFTLFVLSFLIKDNPLYKIAESVFIGVSAAYWMVVAFWDTLLPNLIAKVFPGLVRDTIMPGLSKYEVFEWPYLIPLVLGVMLLWRLAPKGGWISRWPMAFFIGTFCGLRLATFIHADFLSQIRNSIMPLVVLESSGIDAFWDSLKNIILVIGVLACIVYFFFSFEHKGVIGGTARLGIWFLMITFGAAFGYTVMGRIALLAIRIEFLFDDWLWLVDPTGKRAAAAAETAGAFILAPLGLM